MKRKMRRLFLSLGRLGILLIGLPGILAAAIALILGYSVYFCVRTAWGIAQIIFILVCAAIDPDGEEHV